MKTEQLVLEARDELRAMKDHLANMDKNLAVAIHEMQVQRRDLDQQKKDQDDMNDKITKHEKHITVVNSAFKFMTILGGVLVFAFEAVPFIQNFLKN